MTLVRITLGMMLMAGLAACGAGRSAAPYEALPVDVPQAPAGHMALVQEDAMAGYALATPRPAEMHRAATTLEQAPAGEQMASLSTDAPAMPMQQAFRAMRLVDYEIRIPEALTVSEANLYYPLADIVWRDDPYGNRKEQVAAMFQTTLDAQRTRAIDGPQVKAIIELTKFHGITEKTRYTIGGWHEIRFLMTLVDVNTGQVLVNQRKVRGDIRAFGGQKAILAERQGHGQKARVLHQLGRVINAELTQPGGWSHKDRDLQRAIDQI